VCKLHFYTNMNTSQIETTLFVALTFISANIHLKMSDKLSAMSSVKVVRSARCMQYVCALAVVNQNN